MSQFDIVLQELETIRDERRTHANTANRVGTAMIDMLGLIGNLDFLPLTGGTMRNSNLVTNLNADLLDGHHADYFATEAALATLAGTVGSHTSAIATLEGYFTEGVAKSALRLSGTATHSAWGRTYWENGQPKDLSGTLDGVMDINMTGVINIGGFRIERTEDGLKFNGNIYATGGVAALGTTGSSGGDSGGSTGGAAYMRDLIDVSITTPVDGQVLTYQNGYWVAAAVSQQTMPDLSGYATRQWVEQQGYLTTHQSLAGYAKEAYVQQACDSVVGHVASNFVAKESGKGLSTNDFTDILLAKLNGIEEGANKYVHPAYSEAEITASAGKVLSAITVNSLGHVTSVASKTLATADIPALAASKITSGTFDAARIPGLTASKITSGTFDVARIPSLTVSKISDFPTTWAWSKITETPTTLDEYGITDAATAAQMTAAAGRLTALEGYFTEGVAKSALRLSGTATYTVWGQTYWQSGAPKGNVTGAMTGVTSIDSFMHLSSSRLGIGASSPAQRLHVAHDGRNMLRLERTDVSGQYVDIGVDDDGFNISAHNTSRSLWVDGDSYIDGNLEIGASLSIDGFIVERTEDGLKFHGNIFATGGVAALGTTGDSGGSTGGATYLRELLDVSIGTLSDGQVLTYRNGYWTPGSAPTADLSAYATQQWVEQNWQIKSMSTIYDDSQQALIYGDYVPYDIKMVNGVLTVTYGHLPYQTVDWEDIEDRPDVVTALGASGDYVTWTREGVTNNLTVPFATRASELRRNHISSGTLDANTMTIGGTKYAIAANYYSTDAWLNAPSGMSYGAVMELTAGSGVGVLSGQLAWDVTHGSTTPTHRLWWRARNSSGWGNDWKEIAFADEYLPLTAGSEKPLTGSLYFIGNAGINWADGAGMMACKPTSGWTGISSTQWGVGSLSAQGVIRSNNSDLLHYKNSASYTIWDSSNFRPGAEYTSWTDFQDFAAHVQADYATTAALNTALTDYLPLTAGTNKPLTGILWMNADLVIANPNNTTNDTSQKIAFYTNKNYPNVSPYIQAIYESSYGRKRLSVFQKNVADWDTPQTEVLSVLPDGRLRLTQAIAYKGTKATYDMIRLLDNTKDTYGNGIAIGGGGMTVIGGGESAATIVSGWLAMDTTNHYAGNELMYIGNDGAVSIFTNLQDGWEYRKEFYFGADGRFWLPAGVGGRQAILHPDGQLQVRAVTGGWAYSFGAYTNAGSASLGQFAAHGANDSLTYMYIGRAYNDTWMVVKPSGNVGIGTTTPNDYKLDVAGAIRASGSGGYGIVLDNDQAVTLRDSTGAHMRSMFLNSVNLLAIGYGTTKTGGYDTQLCGQEIILSTGGGSGTDPIEAARFTADGKLKIGNGYIEWDYTNNMLKFSGGNGIYAMGGVSALGIAGDIDGQVTRAMTFTEAVTMRKTLGVTGQLTLNNSSTLASSYALLANGKVRIASTLAVTGAATFGGALTVSGDTSLESTTISTLGVEGKSEFADDMMLDGKLIFGTGADDDCIYVNNGHLYFRPAGGSALLIK